MRKLSAVLFGCALFLGSASDSSSGESSERAVANGPGFHLTSLHIFPPLAGADKWTVSGFALGVGTFSQSVNKDDIKIDYSAGTAKLITTVTSSLGLTVPITVNWTATSSQITQTVSIPNPSRTLTNNFKRASVSGTVGTFTIGAGATGSIGKRNIVP